MKRPNMAGLGLLILIAGPAFGEAIYESGPQQVTLMELYTSQGCSSCPPADKWVGKLKGRPGLWEQFIPLAFHVNYWDYIGWQDRFASEEHTHRQARYQAEGGVRVLYTPGVMSNGIEWTDWRNVTQPHISLEESGVLKVSVDDGVGQVVFTPLAASANALTTTIAILGFDLESDINAGENRGRRLSNDFVVLGMSEVKMVKSGDAFVASIVVPPARVRADRRALVVWVSPADRQRPLQAAGGWYVE